MQLLRSLLFTALLMTSACVWGGVLTMCFFLPHRVQFAMARAWARWSLSLLGRLCGLHFIVEGCERIPDGSHIVMCKHTSAWETLALFVIFPPHVWVLKRELLWIPLMGWGLKLLRPIAIDRGAGHRAVNRVIEQGQERLAEGLWVIIFPEGTRVAPGQTRKYGMSGALLAAAAGRLVVPVAHNAGEFWPRRGILKRPGTIRVVIGEPIPAAGREPLELNAEIRRAIEGGMARIAGNPQGR
ncbi:MAG TPA: lysophospholipid acyltransferase family protein [Steroidobacteraceae bacterium]|jgi:1-acyl-sn-glycerol-3-phosphate acyltransferase|nr:lysophospholipid acyltransferase family protein [Steroidobacteraceae bacterium]